MYRVAVDKARGLSKMEPVAICNYGIFLYNQRKDVERAVELLRVGLQRLVDDCMFVCTYICKCVVEFYNTIFCNDTNRW